MRPFAIVLALFPWLMIVDCVSIGRFCDPETGDDFQRAHVGLIISPIMSIKMIREIEIYWNHVKYRPGDTIALYTSEPTSDLEPIYTLIPNAPSGIERTGVQATFVPTSSLMFVQQCLQYYVAWLRNGTIRLTNCLQTHPQWMAERRNSLGLLSMSRIFLPGTHDSASYAIHEQANSENIVEKFVITQDVDVLAQLIYGVRYLDIRVGHYPNTNSIWWANHGVFKSVPMQNVVNQVKTFLDNTNEIVIFDIQEFPVGFGKNLGVHHNFVGFLEEQFAGYYLPKSYGWTSTLNTIWSSGKRLIIGYDEKRVVNRYESIWPCVTHQWGNVRNIEDLFNYLNRIETESLGYPRAIPRSAMAELTPNTWDVILNRLGSIREMAEKVNINVTNWYNSKWQHTANIVAVDFVRSSGIIETAIEWNEKRNSHC
ncbi:PI-PLC X domain-containing protein 1 isoform X1 [Camponotus floridanus]|uniref:PI-PLC X domain-containing protein 1 isoform X1 n=1 Tax=Camponotus floridanus TaxID=104421 RepID=UPI000DC68F1A|nr:PI-PLC X domain-containing protein 1 isoform X1 [Camponotus floridanus]XP_025270506.1 PI-PLC X domain-containing protein 1 isoform X1 [Camponotus floridanus]